MWTALGTAAVIFGVLVGIDSLAVTHGLARSLAIAGAVFFGALASITFFVRPFALRPITRLILIGLAVTSVAVLVVGPGKSSHHPSAGADQNRSVPATSTAGPASPSASKSTPPRIVGAPVPAPDDCGPEASVSVPLPAVQICVYYWCRGDVFNTDGTTDEAHAQIKVRPRIINNRASTLNVDISTPSAIRLLISEPRMPGSWGPPPLTARAGDRPIAVSYRGQQFWALPPNVPHDATAAANGMYTGFATSWTATDIAPGGSAYFPLRHRADGSPIQEGDLVFQLPQDALIVGLAVVSHSSHPTVLGIQLQKDWPKSSEPGSF